VLDNVHSVAEWKPLVTEVPAWSDCDSLWLAHSDYSYI